MNRKRGDLLKYGKRRVVKEKKGQRKRDLLYSGIKSPARERKRKSGKVGGGGRDVERYYIN